METREQQQQQILDALPATASEVATKVNRQVTSIERTLTRMQETGLVQRDKVYNATTGRSPFQYRLTGQDLSFEARAGSKNIKEDLWDNLLVALRNLHRSFGDNGNLPHGSMPGVVDPGKPWDHPSIHIFNDVYYGPYEGEPLSRVEKEQLLLKENYYFMKNFMIEFMENSEQWRFTGSINNAHYRELIFGKEEEDEGDSDSE